jgi:hypothetical protein
LLASAEPAADNPAVTGRPLLPPLTLLLVGMLAGCSPGQPATRPGTRTCTARGPAADRRPTGHAEERFSLIISVMGQTEGFNPGAG